VADKGDGPAQLVTAIGKQEGFKHLIPLKRTGQEIEPAVACNLAGECSIRFIRQEENTRVAASREELPQGFLPRLKLQSQIAQQNGKLQIGRHASDLFTGRRLDDVPSAPFQNGREAG